MDGHAEPRIHLWLGAAEALASRADVSAPPFRVRSREDRDATLTQMLGVALAHEIGHYLLDTSHHAPNGLLQPVISLRDFEAPDLTHLRLNPDQRRQLCLRRPA